MYAKNIWKNLDPAKKAALLAFNEDYKSFLSVSKTERLAVKASLALAETAGFVPLSSVTAVKPGDRLYAVNKNKNLALFVVGKKPLDEGLLILGAHVDSPRLDIKQNPLYEKDGFAFLDTHYYGGIKKYQWVTFPLALHGVVCKKDGSVVEIAVGEDEKDPVLGITDLLVHLSADQMKKTADVVIEGENLDVTVGNVPLDGTEKDSVKAAVLAVLKEKYGIEEEDFISSELEIVPAGKARDYGLDRSMVAGYGHDDRVCAYTSLRAILDLKEIPETTSCCILVDKEEIGSVGATGAHSVFFENILAELLALAGKQWYLDLKRCLSASRMLSSDVSAAFDPLYPSVSDAKNNANFGNGIVFNKYTGSRGKSGSNDANPEFLARIRNLMDEGGIHYQTSELGKVDQGGGGTIAYILGNLNLDVLDAGVAVLNMHSPMEIVSKADVYEAYLAYGAFLLSL